MRDYTILSLITSGTTFTPNTNRQGQIRTKFYVFLSIFEKYFYVL